MNPAKMESHASPSALTGNWNELPGIYGKPAPRIAKIMGKQKKTKIIVRAAEPAQTETSVAPTALEAALQDVIDECRKPEIAAEEEIIELRSEWRVNRASPFFARVKNNVNAKMPSLEQVKAAGRQAVVWARKYGPMLAVSYAASAGVGHLAPDAISAIKALFSLNALTMTVPGFTEAMVSTALVTGARVGTFILTPTVLEMLRRAVSPSRREKARAEKKQKAGPRGVFAVARSMVVSIVSHSLGIFASLATFAAEKSVLYLGRQFKILRALKKKEPLPEFPPIFTKWDLSIRSVSILAGAGLTFLFGMPFLPHGSVLAADSIAPSNHPPLPELPPQETPTAPVAPLAESAASPVQTSPVSPELDALLNPPQEAPSACSGSRHLPKPAATYTPGDSTQSAQKLAAAEALLPKADAAQAAEQPPIRPTTGSSELDKILAAGQDKPSQDPVSPAVQEQAAQPPQDSTKTAQDMAAAEALQQKADAAAQHAQAPVDLPLIHMPRGLSSYMTEDQFHTLSREAQELAARASKSSNPVQFMRMAKEVSFEMLNGSNPDMAKSAGKLMTKALNVAVENGLLESKTGQQLNADVAYLLATGQGGMTRDLNKAAYHMLLSGENTRTAADVRRILESRAPDVLAAARADFERFRVHDLQLPPRTGAAPMPEPQQPAGKAPHYRVVQPRPMPMAG